jgi:SAM-dependent methyltransferase
MQVNRADISLNGICPYFTMFPIEFPLGVLATGAKRKSRGRVLDPFCGRGTSNFAARLLGYSSFGIDGNPVAVAVSQAKLAKTTPQRIMDSACAIIDRFPIANDMPSGEFWDLAYHPEVLNLICRFREGLLQDCRSDTRIALRAIILGALHGPKMKTKDSYFSNQSQRTYAPKPAYASRYWKERGLKPAKVDVMRIIEERAQRYFKNLPTRVEGQIILGDSRDDRVFDNFKGGFDWIITSPPYYGMRTYFPDQWLRLWFLGGKPIVTYSMSRQVQHNSPDSFAGDLNRVWINVGKKANPTQTPSAPAACR